MKYVLASSYATEISNDAKVNAVCVLRTAIGKILLAYTYDSNAYYDYTSNISILTCTVLVKLSYLHPHHFVPVMVQSTLKILHLYFEILNPWLSNT